MTKLATFCATVAATSAASFAALAPACAQQPNSSFVINGHIEQFTLDAGGGDLRGGSIRVSNIDIVLPANILITMPGRYITPKDLFGGPNIAPSPNPKSGVALADTPAPAVPFEAEVIGNIVGNRYIAGVMRLSQGALHVGAGVIVGIDNTTGELQIGAPGGATHARVIFNDPTGVYGPANNQGAKASIAFDQRFAVDPENAAIHARTGFPLCAPANGTATTCPATNRPPGPTGGAKRFTCGATLANQDAPAIAACDPHRPAPLAVGDYVTYSGIVQPDGQGGYRIAAYALIAELGIYTSPGTDPAYVSLEEAIQGAKGERFPQIPQEETTRFRVVGFTTDPSRNVEVKLIDSGRDEAGFSISGPGGLTPANGAQLGRVRNTWPAKDDARAVRRDAQLRIVGGVAARMQSNIWAGVFTGPMSEYIGPEPVTFGVNGMTPPFPFENFCFLKNGGGSVDTANGPRNIAVLQPFPNSGHPDSQLIGNGPARVCN